MALCEFHRPTPRLTVKIENLAVSARRVTFVYQ